MSESKGRLFLIAGPSGVGKKSILEKILPRKHLNLVFSVSCTTRAKRDHETNGVDYWYISKEEFKKKIAAGEMLEYAEFFNNYYGTSKEYVDEQISKGKNVLLEVDTLGFNQVIQKVQDLISVFILPPSMGDLEKRLRQRGTESEEEIKMRLEKAEEEVKDASRFTHQVVNDDLDRVVEEMDVIFSKYI